MTTTTEPTAVGIFENLEQAERTVEALRQAGFPPDEIGIMGHVGTDQAAVPAPPQLNFPEENATQGVILGGVIGGVIGALVILVIPGLAQVSGLGRWFEVLGGLVLGAAAGGFMLAAGSFVFKRRKSHFIAQALREGHFVVTVADPGRKEEALSILRRQAAR